MQSLDIYSRVSKIKQRAKKHWGDIGLILGISLTAGIVFFQLGELFHPIIFEAETIDTWFQADIPRVFQNMTSRISNHYRTSVHPIFSILAYSPTLLLRKLFHIDPIAAVRLVNSGFVSLWTGALFTLLRAINLHKIDAFLFTMLGLVSSAGVFWMSVPETYLPGSITIIFALLISALASKRRVPSVWYMLVSALTLSVTVTNWMAGILTTIVSFSLKKTLQISSYALSIVTGIWAIQKYIFPSATFFLVWFEETKYINLDQRATPFNVARSFLFHSIVTPAIEIIDNIKRPAWPIMSVQNSALGSSSVWGNVAIVFWVILLAFGIWGFCRSAQWGKFRIVLGFLIIGQLSLHVVYGDETFLYSLHFLPLLIVLASFSTQSRWRIGVLVLTGLLIITAGTNNILQFREATQYYDAQVIPQNDVLLQMDSYDP